MAAKKAPAKPLSTAAKRRQVTELDEASAAARQAAADLTTELELEAVRKIELSIETYMTDPLFHGGRLPNGVIEDVAKTRRDLKLQINHNRG